MSNNSSRGAEALFTLERELKSRDRKEKLRPLNVVALSLLAIVAVVGGVWFAATRNDTSTQVADSADASAQAAPTTVPAAVPLTGVRSVAYGETVTCTYNKSDEDSHGATIPGGDNIAATGTVQVTFATTQGDIGMILDRAAAPCTVNAITSLANQGYYNNSICHRMTSGALNVLQCGDPTGTGSGGPGFQFANEYPSDDSAVNSSPSVIYPKGSIAMANAGQDTNGSQFFINYEDSNLTPDYTYFGKLTDQGQQTLDQIAKKGIKDGAEDGAPAEEVKITSVTVA